MIDDLARQEELPDAVERVVLPAPVTEKIVLHSSTHGVETPVGDSDDMKWVRHANRVIEMRAEPGPVGLRQFLLRVHADDGLGRLT